VGRKVTNKENEAMSTIAATVTAPAAQSHMRHALYCYCLSTGPETHTHTHTHTHTNTHTNIHTHPHTHTHTFTHTQKHLESLSQVKLKGFI
jgi:hypothetical protein